MKDATERKRKKLIKRMQKDLNVKWFDDSSFTKVGGTERQKRAKSIQIYNQAKEKFDEGKYLPAIEKLMEMEDECDLNKEPKWPSISLNKAVCNHKLGNDEEAVAQIKDAVLKTGGKWDDLQREEVMYCKWNLSVIRLKNSDTSGVLDMLLPMVKNAKYNTSGASHKLNQEYPLDRLLLMRAMIDGRWDLVENILSSVIEDNNVQIWDTDGLDRYIKSMEENRVIKLCKDGLAWVKGFKINAVMERLSLLWRLVRRLDD